MVKIIIIAVAALVIATGATVGVMMFLAPKAEVQEEAAAGDSTSTAIQKPAENATSMPVTDSTQQLQSVADSALQAAGLSSQDMSSIDNIVANLKQLPNPEQETSSETGAQLSAADTVWIQQQKDSLQKRTKELEDWQKKLEKREADVNRKLLVIEQAQSSRIASLAKLYDNMDPSAAAQVLAGIDDETIVQVLPRMKTQNAAAILGQLPPQRAAILSKKMISLVDEGS